MWEGYAQNSRLLDTHVVNGGPRIHSTTLQQVSHTSLPVQPHIAVKAHRKTLYQRHKRSRLTPCQGKAGLCIAPVPGGFHCLWESPVHIHSWCLQEQALDSLMTISYPGSPYWRKTKTSLFSCLAQHQLSCAHCTSKPWPHTPHKTPCAHILCFQASFYDSRLTNVLSEKKYKKGFLTSPCGQCWGIREGLMWGLSITLFSREAQSSSQVQGISALAVPEWHMPSHGGIHSPQWTNGVSLVHAATSSHLCLSAVPLQDSPTAAPSYIFHLSYILTPQTDHHKAQHPSQLMQKQHLATDPYLSREAERY